VTEAALLRNLGEKARKQNVAVARRRRPKERKIQQRLPLQQRSQLLGNGFVDNAAVERPKDVFAVAFPIEESPDAPVNRSIRRAGGGIMAGDGGMKLWRHGFVTLIHGFNSHFSKCEQLVTRLYPWMSAQICHASTAWND
jgi:hypothetical protein